MWVRSLQVSTFLQIANRTVRAIFYDLHYTFLPIGVEYLSFATLGEEKYANFARDKILNINLVNFVWLKIKNVERMKHRIFILLIMLLSSMSISAQKFVLDPLFGDSVKCNVAVKADTVWKLAEPLQYVTLEKGLEIESCGKTSHSFYVAFKHNGKTYMVSKDMLKFSANNEDGSENPLSDEIVKKHSATGHFYATYIPLVMMGVLTVFTFLLYKLYNKNKKLRRYVIKALPASMALLAIIEIVGFWYMGGDFFWWCDKERFGFFGSLLRMLPMVLIMLYQILSFNLFENVLFDEEDHVETTRLSIFPAAIGLLACIPVVIAYFVIVQWWLGWKGGLCDGIGLILFLLTLVGGIYIAYRRNLELLGKKQAFAATIFTVIYVIGIMIAIWGVILMLFRLLFEVIMFAVAMYYCRPIFQVRLYRGSDGHTYSKSDFETTYTRVD